MPRNAGQTQCPLLSNSGQIVAVPRMSALCHKRTHAPQQSRRDSTGQFCHWATPLKRLVAGTHQTRLVWLCSASDAHVDSAAERAEIDRLIPSLNDQNPCAQWRSPMDMILQG